MQKKLKTYEYIKISDAQYANITYKKIGINFVKTFLATSIDSYANVIDPGIQNAPFRQIDLSGAVNDLTFTTLNFANIMSGIDSSDELQTLCNQNGIVTTFKYSTQLYQQITKLGKTPKLEAIKFQLDCVIPTLMYHITDITDDVQKRKFLSFKNFLYTYMSKEYNIDRAVAAQSTIKTYVINPQNPLQVADSRFGPRNLPNFNDPTTNIVQLPNGPIDSYHRNPVIMSQLLSLNEEFRKSFISNCYNMYGSNVTYSTTKLNMKYKVNDIHSYYILFPLTSFGLSVDPNYDTYVRVTNIYSAVGVEPEVEAVMKALYDKKGRKRLKKKYKSKYKKKYRTKYKKRYKKKYKSKYKSSKSKYRYKYKTYKKKKKYSKKK